MPWQQEWTQAEARYQTAVPALWLMGRQSEYICDAIEAVYDLTPRGIINWLDLRKPVYKNTSAYGHFGNVIGEERTWEKTDTAEKLLDAIK